MAGLLVIALAASVLAACTPRFGETTDAGASREPSETLMSFAESTGAAVYTSRMVSWRMPVASDDEGNAPALYYCADERSARDWSDLKASEIQTVRGILVESSEVDENKDYVRFEAEMTDLSPGVYTYRVGTTDNLSEPVTFRAEGAPNQTAFVFLGDVQPDSSLSDYEVFGKIIDSVYREHPDIDFALQSGDIGNVGNAQEEWAAFLSYADRVFDRIPLMTAIGNHEVSPYVGYPGHKPSRYLDTFSLPRNGPAGFEEEFYSFEYGAVHVTVLSSNYQDPEESYSDDPAENERISAEINRWIEDDLAAGADKPWRIVMMHHPAFPLVSDSMTESIQNEWLPIFERTDVSLILCGHQHEFMRTKPWLNGAKEDAAGLVQIMGNASKKTYPLSGSGLGYIAFEQGDTSGYHYIVATDETLSITAFDADGNRFDHFEMEKLADKEGAA